MLGVQKLAPRQGRAVNAELAALNIWEGSVRSGKTVGSYLRWARWLIREAPRYGDLAVIGKTQPTVIRNVLNPMVEVFGRKHVVINRGLGEVYLFGRRHYIVGANDERAEGKIRGLTLAGWLGDEVTLWPESFFDMLNTRTSVDGAVGLGTTNPDSPLHWLMRDWIAREDRDLKRETFKLRDNVFLDRAFIERLEREYTGLFKRRYIDGEWVVAEGSVYGMLDLTERAGVRELPELVEHWLCADYGTTNPTVYLLLSLGTDGRLYVHHEWRHDSTRTGRTMTDSEYSAALKQHLADVGRELNGGQPLEVRRLYIDPSAASFSVQLYRDGVRGVVPANNEVLDGIREVSMLVSADRLRFHLPSLKELPSEMESYSWDPKASKKGEDRPIKVNDHGPDALRYGVRGTRSVWRPWMSAPIPEAEETGQWG